jgi:lipopolysaccharide transport system permease protein
MAGVLLTIWIQAILGRHRSSSHLIRLIFKMSTDAHQELRHVSIHPTRGLFDFEFREIGDYFELLFFLVWRDLKVRYKQTAMGVAWVLLQPLVSMIIFSVIFGRIVGVPSDGAPYPLFAFAALVPWNFFATTLNRCATGLVSDANLLSKVYFPRIILPLSASLSGLADFAIALIISIAMLAWYGVHPTGAMLLVPVFAGLALITALAFGLWLAPLNAQYRDVAIVLPFVIQVWMFVSPVIYPVSLVPQRWRLLYGLNPMVGVIEGFRMGLLGTAHLDWSVVGMSAAAVLMLLMGGLVYFGRAEQTLADVV